MNFHDTHDAHRLYLHALSLLAYGQLFSNESRELAADFIRDRILDESWSDDEVEERNLALLIETFIRPKKDE